MGFGQGKLKVPLTIFPLLSYCFLYYLFFILLKGQRVKGKKKNIREKK
jgi:hypothetical protein